MKNTSNPKAALEASQRLLNQIVGSGATDTPSSAPQTPAKRVTMSGAPNSKIGMIFDAEGVMLVRAHHGPGGCSIEKVEYAPYPAPAETLLKQALFAAQALEAFAPDYRQCELWTEMPESDVSILTLPKVKPEEMDAVALLNANRTVKVDPQRSVFDYRIQSESLLQGVPQLRALGLSAPASLVAETKDACVNAGLKLAGLTSSKFSVESIFSSGFERSPWQSYAVLQVESEVSDLAIIEGGVVVLLRTFNFGMKQFLADVIEHLALTDLGNVDEDLDRRQKRLAKEAERLFTTSSESDENRQLIDTALQANIERAFKYIERTFGYYERMENGRMPEGMIFIADLGVGEVIGRMVETRMGVPCIVRHMNGPMRPEVEGQVDKIRQRFKSPMLFNTVGLALANDHLPNLMELPEARRRRKKVEKALRALKLGTTGVCATLLAFGAYCGWSWMDAKNQLQALEAQKAQLPVVLTAADLDREMATLKGLEAQGAALLDRRRFAALLAELADIRSDDVYITGVEYHPEGVKTRTDRRRSAQEQNATPMSLLVLHTLFYGNAQTREAALADMINRLEGIAGQTKLTVHKEESAAGGAAYVIRLTGRF